MRIRRIVVAGVVVAAGLGIAVLVLDAPAGLAGAPNPLQSVIQAQSQEIPAVKSTITNALILNVEVGYPISTRTGALKPVPAELSAGTIASVPPTPTQTELDQIRAYDTQQLTAVFAHDPTRLNINLYGLSNAIAEQQKPDTHLIDAGISALDFTKVSVTGDTAKALVTAREWALITHGSSIQGARTSRQPAILHWTVGLQKIGGAWAITSTYFAFDPSTHP